MLSVKLAIIKGFDCGEQNKDNVHALNFGSENAQKIFPFKLIVVASKTFATKVFIGRLDSTGNLCLCLR